MLSAASQVQAPGTGVPITESLCHTGAGTRPGEQDKPIVPPEIVHGRGIAWIKLDSAPKSRETSRCHCHHDNRGTVLLPKSSPQACLAWGSFQAEPSEDPGQLLRQGSGGPAFVLREQVRTLNTFWASPWT